MKPLSMLTEKDFIEIKDVCKLRYKMQGLAATCITSKEIYECLNDIKESSESDSDRIFIFSVAYDEITQKFFEEYVRFIKDKEYESSIKRDLIPIDYSDLEILDQILKSRSDDIEHDIQFLSVNGNVYTDEQTYYKKVWYKENCSKSIINKKTYSYLGKLFDYTLHNEKIYNLDVKVLTYGDIRDCTIKTLRLEYFTDEEKSGIGIIGSKINDLIIKTSNKEILFNFYANKVNNLTIDISDMDRCKNSINSMLPIRTNLFHNEDKNEIKKLIIKMKKEVYEELYRNSKIIDIERILDLSDYTGPIEIIQVE